MVTAKSDSANYRTIIAGSSGEVLADVSADRGGTGEGLKPFELLLGGFVSCLNITLRMLLDKKGIAYRSVSVTADETREKKPGTMQISFRVELDADITEEEKTAVIARAFEKCPVHNALAGDIEFVMEQEEVPGQCRYCGKCAPCPKGINIPELTRLLNLAKAGGEVTAEIAQQYKAMAGHAEDCMCCGRCEARCPHGVKVRCNMEEAWELFGY